MARHKVTIQPASADELANITFWYREAGVEAGIVNDGFRAASRSGLLGSALGGGIAGTKVVALHPHPAEAALTRSCALSLRLNGDTIGMLVLGPPGYLIDRFFAKLLAEGQRPSPDDAQDLFWRLLINVTKLDLVAIHPEHRGRGHGARLVRHSLDLARQSLLIRVFGEYRQDRPHLADFYSKLGFTVLADFEYLDLSRHVGRPFSTHATPGERMIVRAV